MRILNWNIRHGGGSRRRAIVEAVLCHEPDVVVLTEYREAPAMLAALAKNDFVYQVTSTPPPRKNGVALVSRYELAPAMTAVTLPEVPGRWLEVHVTEPDLRLAAIYLPGASSTTGAAGKAMFWRAIHTFARLHRTRNAIVIGDFNTGAHWLDETRATFRCADMFAAMETELRWRDAWRLHHGDRREYTWWSRGKGGRELNGYRLDHVFVSPPLVPFVAACAYSQNEREKRISDHAIQIVDLRLPGET